MTKDEKTALESLPGMTPALLARLKRDYTSIDNLRDWAMADPKGTAYSLNISVERLRMWVPDIEEAQP